MGPAGGMAEWLKAAVLKTVVPKGTGGSNPSPSVDDSELTAAMGNAREIRSVGQGCSLTNRQSKNFAEEVPRRDGREAEGAGLLNL